MTRTLTALLAFTGFYVFGGAEWHVDASAADGGVGSLAAPYNVIQDAVAAAGENDTIHVAAGVYDRGGVSASSCSNRVYITGKPGLRLIGAGRGKSIIVGSRDPEAGDTYADDLTGATRCVWVSGSTGAIIEGFSLRDGETLISGTATSNGSTGGGFRADGEDVYLVDCDVVHCAGKYGSAIYQGTAVRCLFDKNYGTGGPGGYLARLVNCVVTRSVPSGGSTATLNKCKIFNTTLVDNATTWAVQDATDEVYNSLLMLSGNKEMYRETNKVETVVANSVLANDAPKGYVQVVGTLTGDWRLLNDSDAVAAGDPGWLTGLALPVAVNAFKDFHGHAIIADGNGKINAGAIQETVTPAGGKLVFPKSDLVSVNGYAMRRSNGGYVYPETYPTQFCVKPILADGEYLYRIERYNSSGASIQSTHPGFIPKVEGGVSWMMPPPDVTEISSNNVVKATTVLWCDDAHGDDGYAGDDLGSSAHPYKTIQAAVNAVALKTATVIFVKPGRYDSVATDSGGYGVYRLYASSRDFYLRIASTDGPGSSFIVGESDPDTVGDGTDYAGCGPKAVKCACLIGAGLVLQGFTLTEGYGYGVDAALGLKYATGFRSSSVDADAAMVVDCVISNCVSSASICNNGTFRRCEFVHNTSLNQVLSTAFATGCFFHDNQVLNSGTGFIGPVLDGPVYNCTFVGTAKSGRLYNSGIVSYNSIFDGGLNVYSTAIMTNCIAYNYKNMYSPSEITNSAPMFVVRTESAKVASDSPAVALCTKPDANNYGAEYWRYMDGDLYGEPIMFSESGQPTAGAAQKTVPVKTLSFVNPANGGIETEEGLTGDIRIFDHLGAQSVSFVSAAGTRPCAGVTIGGVDYWFTNTLDNVITLGYADVASFASPVSAAAIYTTDWYVDDDGDDSRSGMLPSLARKTLVSGMSLCSSGDTLWALPGTYDSGVAGMSSSHGVSNRVVVKAGVTLRSTKGAKDTIIAGADASAAVKDGYGCGPDAVRCLALGGVNATVRGFTLKGGRTCLDTKYVSEGGTLVTDLDLYGGGVLTAASTIGRNPVNGYYVEDCIITNCVGYYGAAVARACLIRSKAVGNTALHSMVYQGSAYGSYLDRNLVSLSVFSYSLDIVGTTIGPDNAKANGTQAYGSINTIGSTDGSAGFFRNSLFCVPTTPGGTQTTTIRNCVFAKGSDLSKQADTDGSVNVATDADGIAIDDNGVPVIGKSLAVDAGSTEWIDGDTYAFLDKKSDLSGNQRIYNGRLDVGCFEADWRTRYAKDLGRVKMVTVAKADPMVVESFGGLAVSNGVAKVTLANDSGASVVFTFMVRVTGNGTLAVELAGESLAEVTSADGKRNLTFTGSLAENELTFTYTPGENDTGAAELSEFTCSGGGFVIFVR